MHDYSLSPNSTVYCIKPLHLTPFIAGPFHDAMPMSVSSTAPKSSLRMFFNNCISGDNNMADEKKQVEIGGEYVYEGGA